MTKTDFIFDRGITGQLGVALIVGRAIMAWLLFSKRAYATCSIAFVLDLHKGREREYNVSQMLAWLHFELPGRGLDAMLVSLL